MNTEWQVALSSQGQLGDEYLTLKIDIVVFDPTVETALTYACMGHGVEVGDELLMPCVSRLLPRVETKRGDDQPRVLD